MILAEVVPWVKFRHFQTVRVGSQARAGEVERLHGIWYESTGQQLRWTSVIPPQFVWGVSYGPHFSNTQEFVNYITKV
jgi:hypothetical protein